MQSLSERTASFTDSVIRRMTRISLQYDAVNLSQGFPDFEPPKPILDRLAEVSYEDFHQYSITWGAQDFREALAQKQSRFMGRSIDPNSEIVVTCGSTEAMMAAMMTVTNPCGKVFTRKELELIADLAARYDTYVITDEVYEHIVYAPHRHTYFATLPGMWERTISCSSLSKTYSITGWRLGYIIAPPEIVERAKKVHDFLTVGAAAPLQEAVIPGLKFGQDYYDDLLAKYTHKKKLFLKGLDDLQIEHNDPEGAYYVLMDISEFGYDSDLKFCEDLARLVGVGAVPGSSFFREPVNHLIRFHFAKKDETLLEALNRLESLRTRIPARKHS